MKTLTKKVVESSIRWRGSITDLATDCAYLLTAEEAKILVNELMRFVESPKLSEEKLRGKGWSTE